MGRVKGLPSFAVIAVAVLFGLRALHLAVPLLFPTTRIGPIEVSSFDEARARLGFDPIIPTYRPASLGERPASIAVVFHPSATLIVSWRNGANYLSVTQRRGGSMPDAPEHATPFPNVADSTWWTSGTENHLIVSRVGFWIEITTNLPPSELKRFADTLAAF